MRSSSIAVPCWWASNRPAWPGSSAVRPTIAGVRRGARSCRGGPRCNTCVVADAGTGLQAGITLMQQQRRDREQTPLENGWDVFHTAQEPRRVLRLTWNRVERLWEQAEVATRRV